VLAEIVGTLCILKENRYVFAHCIELFDEYYRIADAKKIEGFSAPLGCELKERLQQMEWLLDQIRPRESELDDITERSGQRMKEHIQQLDAKGLSYEKTPMPAEAQMSRDEGYRLIALMFEIQLYAECFYYFAGRARSIVLGMPKLQSFEAAGVRDVRNHLIEHPEGRASRVMSRSFAFGGGNGPVVKAVREASETAHPDAGLYANAREFAVNLDTALTSAMEELGVS
jgi:hypothetical protein